MDEKIFPRLRVFNLVMGLFHLAQAILMLLLSNSFALPITTSYLSFDSATKTVSPLVETLTSLKIGPAVAVFLFISAAAHFLLTLPGIYEWYVKNLKKGMNLARWYEYSLSSSVMIVVIAMLCGVYDLPSLIMLFALNACMILFGLLMEVHNQTTQKTNWVSFFFGCFAGIVPWIVITMYFLGAAKASSGIIPDFVYAILISLFVSFNIFAVNMVLQYKKVGRWKGYIWGEVVYIILSLVAKSALAWQVFSGTLRPQ
jgi:hypothetical protein